MRNCSGEEEMQRIVPGVTVTLRNVSPVSGTLGRAHIQEVAESVTRRKSLAPSQGWALLSLFL